MNNRLLITSVLIGLAAQSSAVVAAEVELQRFELANGIKVVMAHAPEAPKQTIFTFLPITMADDEAHRAQWSHLMEHMVIRSGDIPAVGLEADGIQFNGETTHTYLRLETFSPAQPADKWRKALQRHAKWLTARSFDAPTLVREKTNIAAEEQNTAAGGYTTKFALAAWNQIVLHGLDHASVHGDVAGATLEAVESYAKARLPIDGSVLIATIGPVDLAEVRAEIEKLIGTLGQAQQARRQRGATEGRATPHAADEKIDVHREFKATWDLPTRHAMWFWKLPDRSPATIAAAASLARAIQAQIYMTLQKTGASAIRASQVYPRVAEHDGGFFVIDCCIASDAEPNQIGTQVLDLVASFGTGKPQHSWIASFSKMISNEIGSTSDFNDLRANLPAHMRDMAEGVWLLSAMNVEYAWGVPIEQTRLALSQPDQEAVKAVTARVCGEPGGWLILEPMQK